MGAAVFSQLKRLELILALPMVGSKEGVLLS
jgi:hypothetical protein